MRNLYTLRYVLCFLLCFAGFTVNSAHAYMPNYSDLSQGYSNCSYKDNGNGTITAKVTISYKSVQEYLGGEKFLSRGVMSYAFNAQGKLINEAVSGRVLMNGSAHGGQIANEEGGVIYFNMKEDTSGWVWQRGYSFSANIEVVVDGSKVSKWPAIGIRAVNYTQRSPMVEISGFAYISASDNGGSCRVLASPDVPLPPPVPTKITMTAPDWNLGELTRGEKNEKTFSAPKEQLCFTYNGAPYITAQKYMINATNENGLSENNRYLLKNLQDSSRSLPYSVTLDSGSTSVSLPNVGNRFISISKAGRMCFVPTFQTDVDKAAKGGAYSDILTFTVVAKP